MQAKAMARIGGQCRALWNHWLAVNAERYAAKGKFAFYKEMSAALPAMRREERFDGSCRPLRAAGLPHRCAQMTVQKLDRALRDCAKTAEARKGFPKFKRRSDRRDAFQFVGRELRFEPGRIKLPALGWLRARGLRVPDGARLVQVTVHQDRGGWGLALQIEAAPPTYADPIKPVVGIDVGLSSLIALSDGPKIEPPRLARRQACTKWTPQGVKRPRRLEREKARRRKGSVNRRRTVTRLNREHVRLAARRRDFTHKLSRRLIDTYEGVAVEKLRLKGLMRTRLAKSFADAGMSVRAWRCAGCEAMHDRDTAAAQVILRGAIPPVRREPAGNSRRKRGAVVRGGVEAQALASHGEPPSNVAAMRATGSVL
jgi:putative transposase